MMYDCPNCAGNLQFDIQTQKMKCSHCSTLIDPYQLDADKGNAEEHIDYDVTMFTCPQCNAQIYSLDTQAAGFCSYCGAATTLNSRLEKVVRPQYIVPFRITKQRCVDIYQNYLKKAKFIPKELQDSAAINSFRGIYIPFWVYKAKQRDSVSFQAVQYKTEFRGNMKYTYKVSGNLNCDYYGAMHDASSAFEDDISEQIMPYDLDRFQKFTPAFMSGFYADIVDVEPNVYHSFVVNAIEEVTLENLKQHPLLEDYILGDDPLEQFDFRTECVRADLVMLPVWLLSYRKGDRIAYIAMNGLTGKIAADMPINTVRYFTTSLLLSIPVFLFSKWVLGIVGNREMYPLFAKLGTISQNYIVSWLTVFVMDIYSDHRCWIWERINQYNDLGKDYVQKDTYESLTKWRHIRQREKTDRAISSLSTTLSCLSVVAIFVFWRVGLSTVEFAGYNIIFLLFSFCLLSAGLGVALVSLRQLLRLPIKKKMTGYFLTLLPFLGTFAAFWLSITGTLSHIIICCSALFGIIAFKDLLNHYNMLSTRKLPQYNYQGGNHHV